MYLVKSGPQNVDLLVEDDNINHHEECECEEEAERFMAGYINFLVHSGILNLN